MQLYFAPGACSLASHIVLRESGLPFDLRKTDTKTKKLEDGSDYFAVNSKGAVPALRLDDGQVLTEGPAILQYIADQKPTAVSHPGPERSSVIACWNGSTTSPARSTRPSRRCSIQRRTMR